MNKKFSQLIFLFIFLFIDASVSAQCAFSLFGNPVDKIVCRNSDAQLGVVTSNTDAVYNFYVNNGTGAKKIGGPLIGGGGSLSVDAPVTNSFSAGNYYIQSVGISTNCTSTRGFYVYFGDIDDLTITNWGGGSVSFSWASCGRSPYVKYEYAVSTEQDPFSVNDADTATTYNNFATVNGLTPNTTYFIHVRVFEVYQQPFGGTNGDQVDDQCFSGIQWQTRKFVACGGTSTTLGAIVPSDPGVCTNGSMTLTSPAASTYQWYKDGASLGTSASVRGQILTVTASGYYSVYITTPTCSGMAFSKYVPEIKTLTGIFSGGGSYCAGEQVKIAVSKTRSDQMYEISKDGTPVITIQGIGTPQQSDQEDSIFYTFPISVASQGTYTVKTFNGNCAKLPFGSAQIVTLKSYGTITPASATICPAGSQVLTTSGGGTYLWKKNNLTFGAPATASITVNAAGTYSVTITNGTCVADAINTSVITVANPTGTITPASASICPGGSQILTATGGTSYQWFLNGVSQGAASASPTFSATQAGTYTVTIFQGTCSGPGSNSSVITAATNPTGTITPASASICPGGSQTLTATGGTSYQWFLNGVSQGAASASSTFSATQAGTYTVTIFQGTCSGPGSNSSVITAAANPTGTITPASASICPGGSQILTATGGNSYQWYKDGNIIGGQTASTYSASAIGIYSVVIFQGTCSGPATNTVTITASAAPTGTIVPATATLCSGGSQVLTATGGTSYQWYKDNIIINGATNNTYAANQTGLYTVIIFQGTCSGPASNSSVLTSGTTPTGTITPATAIICAGTSQTLTATGGTSYEWFKDGVSQGAASPSATFSATAQGVYSVLISNGTCSGPSSNTSAITVTPLPTGSVTPTTGSFCTGGSQLLTATGGGIYEWFKDGVSQGASSATQTFTATATGIYSVRITNNNCSAIAANTSSITETPLPSGTITPATATICTNGSQVLTAAGGTFYVWSRNGNPIIGAPNIATYTATLDGVYSVVITNNSCSAPASNTATVTVSSLPTGIISPATATICAGTSQTLTATGGTSYQWFKDGIPQGPASASTTFTATLAGEYSVTIFNNGCSGPAANTSTINVTPLPTGNISPASATICAGTSQTLTATGGTSYEWFLNNISQGPGAPSATFAASVAGTYSVIISKNNCSNAASNTSMIIVTPLPSGTISPAIKTICAGSSQILTATGGTTYQWFKDGVSQGASAASPTFTATAAGTYSVIITSNNCSAPASNTSAITVTSLPTGTITPASAAICVGGSKILTATGGTSYQWLLNGLPIPGAPTTDSYSATRAGVYSVIIMNNNCSAPASNTSTITVDPVPTGTISPVNTVICPGSSQLLTATGGVSYQWYLNSVAIAGEVASTHSATAAGIYTVEIFNANNCKGTASNNAGIIFYAKPAPAFSFDVFCQNQPINFFNNSTAVNSGGVNYTWNFGDNASSALFAPVHTYAEAKSFTVSLTATSATCPLLSDSVKKIVAVKPLIPGIKYPPARVLKNTPFTLAARNIGQQYNWNPSFGLNNANIYNPVVTTSTDLQYTIKIISTGGCITVDTLTVQAFSKSEVFVPKAFTPNGNNANDLLRPVGVNIPDIKYFRVYNRWGQLVFQTATAGEGWNGVYKNVPQPMETYTWIFEGIDANGTVIKASGKTLLVR